MPGSSFHRGRKHPHFGQRGHRQGQKKGGSAGGSGPSTSAPDDGKKLLIYFPPMETFFAALMDIYSNTGAFPPPGGNKRSSNVNMLITGVFPEGHRSKVAGADAYTHILICDTGIDVRDAYLGSSVPYGGTPDFLAIPGGQTNNWWQVVMVFQTTLPNVGRKKIILADRHQTVGSWTTLL